MKWKVKYMQKRMEPPYPFGKTETEVEANSRREAIEKVEDSCLVSPNYKITASPIKSPKCKYCKSTNLAISLSELQCQDCQRYQK